MTDIRNIWNVKEKFSLRLRLTLWYVILLGFTMLIFSGYIYLRLQHSLMAQVDTSLQMVATQALVNTDVDNDDGNGVPSFQNTEKMEAIVDKLGGTDLVVRLVSPAGKTWAGLGYYQNVPVVVPEHPGYNSVSRGKHKWRVYSFPLKAPDGNMAGWLQTAQSLDSVSHALEGLREQLYWAIPLTLLLAGMGGFFLANRALKPIDHITRTAYSISATDLSKRINYAGPEDEVGRLAGTFDAMLDRLQAAFERERRFTDDAAHELRTPLTILKGQIGVALNRPRSKREYENTLHDLEREVDRLIRLSTDLLFLSRLDQGRLFWHWEKVDLSDLIQVITEQVAPLAEEKGITLSEQVETGMHVVGDQDSLIRLFLNLLDNAIKYTPGGGKVRMEANQNGQGVRVAISDTGSGIPPDAIPHIFDRFFRVDADRSRKTGGAGLGLAIAYEIVRQHNGRIEAHSQLGKGTEIVVFLPTMAEAGR